MQKQTVHLILVEPRGAAGEDIYINDVLVAEGYAVATPEVNCGSVNGDSGVSEQSASVCGSDGLDCEVESRGVPTIKQVLNKLKTYKKRNCQ